MGEFNNKTAIIPGGATKIGAAIARAFIAQGAKVVIADINVDDGQNLAQELAKAKALMKGRLAGNTDEAIS